MRHHLLEEHHACLPMVERLQYAAERALKTEMLEHGHFGLRLEDYQQGVGADFSAYLKAAAASEEVRLWFGRIILPPRTGKTVIGAFGTFLSGLETLIVVPTRVLIEQTKKVLRTTLPGVPLGEYSTDKKELVVHGVNIITYKSLVELWKQTGALPFPLARAALIIIDEAHHSMTKQQQSLLHQAFDPRALRIALTATPNYNAERRLNFFFPDLIHEITLAEAVMLDLLAPLRFWVYSVDEDASRVRMKRGDFDQEELGQVMSAAPFLEATKRLRYARQSRTKQALITCRTTTQALLVCRYLQEHRPTGTPLPAIIVHTTPAAERDRVQKAFSRGTIDTIVTVGVLIEGWSSERCKLLIDLSPSPSLVRSTQKFFRPLTKWGSEEAHIHLLIPSRLSQRPILPGDVMEWPDELYKSGTLIGSPTKKFARQQPDELCQETELPIAKVTLRTSILINREIARPLLDPYDHASVRAVLESNPTIMNSETVCLLNTFRWTRFDHPLFHGHGDSLLRYLGVKNERVAYLTFMARYFPEQSRRLYLWQHRAEDTSEISCSEEMRLFIEEAQYIPSKTGNFDHELFWSTVAGALGREPPPDPAAVFEHKRYHRALALAIATFLTKAETNLITWRHGLNGHEPETYEEIGKKIRLTRESVRLHCLRVYKRIRLFIKGWNPRTEQSRYYV